jgi:hypothetical protein
MVRFTLYAQVEVEPTAVNNPWHAVAEAVVAKFAKSEQVVGV